MGNITSRELQVFACLLVLSSITNAKDINSLKDAAENPVILDAALFDLPGEPIVLATGPIEEPMASKESTLPSKPIKKSSQVILKKQPQKKISLTRAEEDRKLGAMVRQFFTILGVTPEGENFLQPKKNQSNIRPGWYVGGLMGAVINQSRLIIWDQYDDPITPSDPVFQHKKRFENTLPAFGIQIGKQFVYGKLLTDISAFFMGSFTNNKVKITEYDYAVSNTYIYENSLKEKYRAGISAALGTPVTDNVSIFGKLGVIYSNFIFHYREPESHGNAGKKMMGIAPGILVKYHPTPKVALSLDVSYMKTLGSMKTGNISSQDRFTYNANIRPSNVTVMLGLNRTF